MSLDAPQWRQGLQIVRKRTFYPTLWGLSEDQNRGVAKPSPRGVCSERVRLRPAQPSPPADRFPIRRSSRTARSSPLPAPGVGWADAQARL